MRDYGAENTSQVTRSKHNGKLGSLRIAFFRGCEDVSIESTDDVLECTELHHGVGDLSHPQRTKTLVKTVPALIGLDGIKTLKEARSEVRGLHSNFNCLERSKEGVSYNLSACGGAQETNGLVLSSLRTKSPLVNVLEHFVKTELSESLK